MRYIEKLQDPRWQKKRLKVFERDKWKCTVCGNDKVTLHVHHLKYNANPWKTKLKYLKTLCKNCHEVESYWQKYTLKIPATLYGSEGVQPTDYNDCPRFKEDKSYTTCSSSSGSSFCLGWYGLTLDGKKVQCSWGYWERDPACISDSKARL
jgi:hypothetical protein